MAEDKDQLVDEQAMDRMAVAPPNPKRSPEGSSDQQMQRVAVSGVDDQDPLSAHPS